jgi:hypothetical protein
MTQTAVFIDAQTIGKTADGSILAVFFATDVGPARVRLSKANYEKWPDFLRMLGNYLGMNVVWS